MNKLLGNMTQEALKSIGADKLVEFYERKTGRVCNCAGRREMLNNVHRAAQRMLERKHNLPKRQVVVPPPPTRQVIGENVHKLPTKPVEE